MQCSAVLVRHAKTHHMPTPAQWIDIDGELERICAPVPYACVTGSSSAIRNVDAARAYVREHEHVHGERQLAKL